MAYTPISLEDPVQDRIRQQFRLGQLQQMVGQQPGAAIAPAAPVPAAGGGLARQIVGGLGGIGGWMGGAALASKFIPHPAAQIGIPLLASILAPKLAEGAVDTVAPGMLDSSAGMAVPGAIGLAAYLATRGKAGKVPGVSTVVATPKPALTQVQASGSAPVVASAAPVAASRLPSGMPMTADDLLSMRAGGPVPVARSVPMGPNEILAMRSGNKSLNTTPPESLDYLLAHNMRRPPTQNPTNARALEASPAMSAINAMDNPVIAQALKRQFGAKMKTSETTPTVFKLRKVIESSRRNRRDAGTRSRPPKEGKFANTGKESLVVNNYPSLEGEAFAELLKTQKKK